MTRVINQRSQQMNQFMAQIKNKPKILIIEDEKFISKAYQVGLAHEGFAVSAAYDGKEGLEKAKKEKPDLILLDIIMPVMDGLTMIKELRKQDWGKDLKVLVDRKSTRL